MIDPTFDLADAFEGPKAAPEDFPIGLLLSSERADPLSLCVSVVNL